MNNLYYVNNLIAQVIATQVDEDGVITDAGMEQMNALGLEREEIIDGLIKEHKNQQTMVDGIDAEITRLKLRKEVYQNKQTSIMTALRPYLLEGEKIETSEYILKWTTSSPLLGLDNFDAELCFSNEEDPLNSYVTEKIVAPTYSFDMNAIKKAVKEEGKSDSPNVLPMEVYINTTKNPKIT